MSKPEPKAEKANVQVTVLNPRTVINGALCGAGALSFLLTKTEAKDLEELGKVRIDGITNPTPNK